MCYWSNFLKKYSNETYECIECYESDHFEGIWICYISDTYFWWALQLTTIWPCVKQLIFIESVLEIDLSIHEFAQLIMFICFFLISILNYMHAMCISVFSLTTQLILIFCREKKHLPRHIIKLLTSWVQVYARNICQIKWGNVRNAKKH